jgi:hypothetical protein
VSFKTALDHPKWINIEGFMINLIVLDDLGLVLTRKPTTGTGTAKNTRGLPVQFTTPTLIDYVTVRAPSD